MAWKNKAGQATGTPETNDSTYNIIGAGTNIVGEVSSNGNIRFDGNLKGNLSTKGRLFVGATGKINGDVNCKNLEIEGKIEGKVVVEEVLSLKSTAKVEGEIITGKLSIEPGAVFNGTCKMGQSTVRHSNAKEREPQPKK